MDQFNLSLVVYFAYGLSFFIMGLVLILESVRTSSNELFRLLRPLAVFGILHGAHEWLEFLNQQTQPLHAQLPYWLIWFQLALLTCSFVALAIYGIQAFRTLRDYFSPLAYFGMVTLPIYILLVGGDVIWAYIQGKINTYWMVSALVRYWLAVPSAALATIGLNAGSTRALRNQRVPLNGYLNWAAFGFALYSVTQFVIPPMPTYFAGLVNTEIFLMITNVPIQVIRTFAGVIMTISMFASANFLEKERQAEEQAVQKMRMDVLAQQEQLHKELLRNTIQAQEAERARIARELHDEMAQTLTAFSLDLGTLQNLLSGDSKVNSILDRLQGLSRQMSQGMYRMVYSLRPPHLDELGLTTAMKSLVEQELSPRGIHAKLEIVGETIRINPLIETVIFRIAQEVITNIIRHSKADEAAVCIEYSPDRISLKIWDNGIGFDPVQSFDAPHGLGLAGMKERAESVGGELQVRSKPGEGTTVVVDIPITEIKVV